MTSVAALIYRSGKWADSIFRTVKTTAPHARFFFVANDPEPPLLKHLQDRNYPFVVQENQRLSDEELSSFGVAPPEYIRRVYQGWNRAIRESDEWCCLVNSDHIFAPGWLEALERERSPQRVVACRTFEPIKTGDAMFKHCIAFRFGSSLEEFNEAGFLAAVEKLLRTATEPGGVYMPCLFHRDTILAAGPYPEGNQLVRGQRRYGDRILFDKLENAGIEHLTVMDSFAYHFKEGEMLD